jgi:hypothetical protein
VPAEDHDRVFLPVLAAAREPLSVERLCALAADPAASAQVGEWVRSAFGRGLVSGRREANLPLQMGLTRRGVRVARRRRAQWISDTS